MKQLWYRLLIPVMLVMVVLVGCGPLNFGLNSRAVTITVNLDEAILNQLLTKAQESVVAVNGEALLAEITSLDFQAPDTIRVFGTRNQAGSTVEGSFDVQTAVEQGALKVTINAVNIPGIAMDSPVIQQINTELSRAFTEQINQQQQGAISSVTVTEEAVALVIEVPFR
jgi:hypothetical protein